MGYKIVKSAFKRSILAKSFWSEVTLLAILDKRVEGGFDRDAFRLFGLVAIFKFAFDFLGRFERSGLRGLPVGTPE
jgi:hypothetical protein